MSAPNLRIFPVAYWYSGGSSFFYFKWHDSKKLAFVVLFSLRELGASLTWCLRHFLRRVWPLRKDGKCNNQLINLHGILIIESELRAACSPVWFVEITPSRGQRNKWSFSSGAHWHTAFSQCNAFFPDRPGCDGGREQILCSRRFKMLLG